MVIGEVGHDDYDDGDDVRNEQLTVHSQDGKAHIFDAVLDRGQSGPATLMVFDTSGKLVYQGEMEGDLVKAKQFSVPATGVYIVKAITAEGEHTQKI